MERRWALSQARGWAGGQVRDWTEHRWGGGITQGTSEASSLPPAGCQCPHLCNGSKRNPCFSRGSQGTRGLSLSRQKMGVQMGTTSKPPSERSQALKATPLRTGLRELPQVGGSIKEARWEQESAVNGHRGAYKGITGLETDL